MKHKDVETYIFTECFVGKVIISRLREKYKLDSQGKGNLWIDHLLTLIKDAELRNKFKDDIFRYSNSDNPSDLVSLFTTKEEIVKTATTEISTLAEKLGFDEGDLRMYVLHDLGIISKPKEPIQIAEEGKPILLPGIYIKVDEVNPSEIKAVFLQALQILNGKELKRGRSKRPEDDSTNKDQIADFLAVEEELARIYFKTHVIDVTNAINKVVDDRLADLDPSAIRADAYENRYKIIEHNRDVIRKRYPYIPSPHKLEAIWKIISR